MSEHEHEQQESTPHDELVSAIARAVGEGLVTKWVCVVEVMDPHGGLELGMMASESMTTWHARGMLQAQADVLAPAPSWARGVEEEDE